MMRLSWIAAILMVVGGPLVAQDSPARLTVHGQGEIAAEPDMATITLGVQEQGKTAQEALRKTSAATNKILGVLRGAEIAERDIQTRDLSLNPVWDNRRYEDNRPPKVVGFTASNTVTVRVRDLDQLGSILDRAVGSGANTFRGLQFGLANPVPVADKARADAVADARRKAVLYAEAAGVDLGQIISLSESFSSTSPTPMRMAEASLAAVPIAAGEVTTTAQVTIVFALQTGTQQ